ncbi:exported protein of unknown function [Thermococcus nautili]|uniref:hypothetical protein n=1 Tax=Thermococcus nautili TaxID=195522 RepID=UPI00255337E3|nr:hypothetical protein [Thermococcus nautili]CAI1492096.1 exported protein of unknown function [Thermococcus nautili]
MRKKVVTAILAILLVFVSASVVLAGQPKDGDVSVDSINPSCYIRKADWDQDSVSVEKDGKVVTLAGIYAEVRASFITYPCTTDPHLTWADFDSGDVSGALFPVFCCRYYSKDWHGASAEAWGTGLGRTWHAFAEVSLG